MSISGNASSSSETISIGELRAALLPDFPEITISKIRYLEDAGLIAPARTASSYRKFSHDDLARVRYVLSAQRDNYLPLKVIKENLDAIDRGLEIDGNGSRARVPALAIARDRDGLPTAAEFTRAARSIRVTRAELLRESGLSEQLLASMEQYGVLTAERNGQFDADALDIAKAVVQMAEFGIEARHLRPFRIAAEREVGLFAQVVTPMMRHRTPEARGRAEETIRELAALSVRVHASMVRSGLRRQLGS
ncbi:MAG: MerR family transcriptional regulator [Antricoccus sp.]